MGKIRTGTAESLLLRNYLRSSKEPGQNVRSLDLAEKLAEELGCYLQW